MNPRMRTRKACLFAPLAPLAVIYLWTIAHFELPYAAIALVHPFIWFFALAYGLPALYVAELILGLPVHYLLERAGLNGRGAYAICGAVAGVAAGWTWAAIIRAGPLPLHRDAARMAFMGLAAGAVGGLTFRKIAAGGDDRRAASP
jgi:hypothetical protein